MSHEHFYAVPDHELLILIPVLDLICYARKDALFSGLQEFSSFHKLFHIPSQAMQLMFKLSFFIDYDLLSPFVFDLLVHPVF